MDNQHKMISGYRDLSQDEIDVVNSIKQAETELGRLWNDVLNNAVDMRWMNIAKTHFEEGFSAFVRAVAKPEPRF